jgi:hypothetical protein
LTTSKQIGFPQAFAKRNNVADYEGAILYWNAPAKAIIVRFTNDVSAKGFIKLVKSDRYGAYLSVSTFLAAYSLDPAEYERRYDYERVNSSKLGIETEDPMYVFVLRKLRSNEQAEVTDA